MTAEQLQSVAELEMRLSKPACNMLAWDGWDAGDISKWDCVPWFWNMVLPNETRSSYAFVTEYRQIPFLRINQETTRRATLVLMALVAHRRAHESLPTELKELVSTYFDAVPLDPWNGQEFGYRPKGFATMEHGYPWESKAKRDKVDAGQPVLWSAGAGGIKYSGELSGSHSPSRVMDAVISANLYLRQEVYGLFFPIPPQTNTPL